MARRRRDVARIEHGKRRFDHGPELCGVGGTGLSQCRTGAVDVSCAVRLRQQHRVGLCFGGCVQVGHAPRRRQRVDADDHLSWSKATRRHGRANTFTGFGFCLGRNSVLQVEDDGIGGQGLGLFQRARALEPGI